MKKGSVVQPGSAPTCVCVLSELFSCYPSLGTWTWEKCLVTVEF